MEFGGLADLDRALDAEAAAITAKAPKMDNRVGSALDKALGIAPTTRAPVQAGLVTRSATGKAPATPGSGADALANRSWLHDERAKRDFNNAHNAARAQCTSWTSLRARNMTEANKADVLPAHKLALIRTVTIEGDKALAAISRVEEQVSGAQMAALSREDERQRAAEEARLREKEAKRLAEEKKTAVKSRKRTAPIAATASATPTAVPITVIPVPPSIRA